MAARRWFTNTHDAYREAMNHDKAQTLNEVAATSGIGPALPDPVERIYRRPS